VDNSDPEESLSVIRRARAMTAVAKLQKESVKRGLDRMRSSQIEAEIAAVRRKRAR
jgi:hypothetical protein